MLEKRNIIRKCTNKAKNVQSFPSNETVKKEIKN